MNQRRERSAPQGMADVVVAVNALAGQRHEQVAAQRLARVNHNVVNGVVGQRSDALAAYAFDDVSKGQHTDYSKVIGWDAERVTSILCHVAKDRCRGVRRPARSPRLV